MVTKIMTMPFHENTKSKVGVVFHQRKRPYNFINTKNKVRMARKRSI